MISGIEFSKICKHIVDPRYTDVPLFNYENSSNGDFVFVNRDFIDFFRSMLPEDNFLNKKYVIIFHNSDQPFDDRCYNMIKSFAIQIYAINNIVKNSIVKTIPIGFVDKQLSFLETLDKTDKVRDIEIYMNFTIRTNPTKRNECYNVFKDNLKVVKDDNISVPEYYSKLLRSKFVLCPEGEGIDTHRIYESLLCGAIPVVLRNELSSLYENLPICIVDKWTDDFYIPNKKEFSTDVHWYL